MHNRALIHSFNAELKAYDGAAARRATLDAGLGAGCLAAVCVQVQISRCCASKSPQRGLKKGPLEASRVA